MDNGQQDAGQRGSASTMPTEAEIAEIIAKAEAGQKYLAILKLGVETWNRWKQAAPGTTLDLSGTDLSEMDLGGVNFSGMDLRGATLSETNLSLFSTVESHLNKRIDASN
jgi:hypothetical protein